MRLVFVLVFLFSSCSILSTVSGQEGRMLSNSLSAEVRNLKEGDIWTDTLKVNRWDLLKYYNSLIEQGYQVYDAPASGLLDLSALADGKYVICWKSNDPGGEYSISSSTTKSGAHNVVILPVKLGTQNQIIASHINPLINIYSTFDYGYKLTMAYGSFDIKQYPGGSRPKKIFFDHCYIEGRLGDNDNFKFEYTEFVLGDSGAPYYYGNVWAPNYNIDMDIVNCRFRFTGQPSTTMGLMINLNGGKVQFINCEFINDTVAQTPSLVVNALVPRTLNFQNTFFDGVSIGFSVYSTQDNGLPIYVNNPVLSGSYINNYYILPAKWRMNKYLKGYPELNITVIKDRTSIQTLDAVITQQRKSLRKSLGTIKRMFYQVMFQNDMIVPDAIKYFDDSDFLIVYRTDIEAVLVNDTNGPRKIKNLTFYENDGVTLFDYRNDENFLLFASDGTNDIVFGFYKGVLKFTAFTDAWENTIYTITDIIHLLRPPAEVSVRNLWPVQDSQLEGSVLYQDLTSIVIIP